MEQPEEEQDVEMESIILIQDQHHQMLVKVSQPDVTEVVLPVPVLLNAKEEQNIVQLDLKRVVQYQKDMKQPDVIHPIISVLTKVNVPLENTVLMV